VTLRDKQAEVDLERAVSISVVEGLFREWCSPQIHEESVIYFVVKMIPKDDDQSNQGETTRKKKRILLKDIQTE
jgi:hypothetical protein